LLHLIKYLSKLYHNHWSKGNKRYVIYSTTGGEFITDTSDAPGGKEWDPATLNKLAKIYRLMEDSMRKKQYVLIEYDKDKFIIDVKPVRK
jgi:hypothetical protein